MGAYDQLSLLPVDPIFGISRLYREDPRDNKIDLCVGVFHDEKLKPTVLHSVKEAEKALISLERNKGYLPMVGDASFVDGIKGLLFGEELSHKKRDCIAGMQTPGGTSALRTSGDFMKEFGLNVIYLPSPSWANHGLIYSQAGLRVERYPYYNGEDHKLEFEELLEFVKDIEKGSFFLFHGCCHNPTGADFTKDQWMELSNALLERKAHIVIDIAYHGLGDGLEEDAWAVRYLADQGHRLLVCYSCSKNFGLYGERVGALFALCESPDEANRVTSHLRLFARSNYSNPPRHGALLANYILSHEPLKKEWMQELGKMRERIIKTRELVVHTLAHKLDTMQFDYLLERKGMFCMLPLEPAQTEILMKDYGIYMTGKGRINITGVNEENVDYLVDAFIQVSGLGKKG